MSVTLEITAIGDSLGIILPKELLEKLGISEGGTLTVTETADGVHLNPSDGRMARQLEVAEKVIRENHNLLRKLAQ